MGFGARAIAGVKLVAILGLSLLGYATACSTAGQAPPAEGRGGDARAPDDASLPAEEEAGGTAGFCENLSLRERGRAKFCDSFDDGDLDDGWDIRTVNGGEATLDPDLKKSGGASFFVRTAPLAEAESANVHLRATAKGQPAGGHVLLSFSVYLTRASFATGAVGIATLDVSQNHHFALYLRDDDTNDPRATLDESANGTRTRHVLTKLPPINAWTRVSVDIDLEGATVSVTYDGEEALTGSPITSLPAQDPTIRLGAVYVFGPIESFEAHFDDVALDF